MGDVRTYLRRYYIGTEIIFDELGIMLFMVQCYNSSVDVNANAAAKFWLTFVRTL